MTRRQLPRGLYLLARQARRGTAARAHPAAAAVRVLRAAARKGPRSTCAAGRRAAPAQGLPGRTSPSSSTTIRAWQRAARCRRRAPRRRRRLGRRRPPPAGRCRDHRRLLLRRPRARAPARHRGADYLAFVRSSRRRPNRVPAVVLQLLRDSGRPGPAARGNRRNHPGKWRPIGAPPARPAGGDQRRIRCRRSGRFATRLSFASRTPPA